MTRRVASIFVLTFGAALLLPVAYAAEHAAATPSPAPSASPAAAASPAPKPGSFDVPAKNLKVLPRDMTKRQVIDQVMKKWTSALGVRCLYCHVGQESTPWTSWDLAADDKPTKQRAREMLEMLNEINRRMGSMSSLHGGSPVQATCFTCHRGMPRPRRIEDVFDETRTEHGVDAAIAEYRTLRADGMSKGGYDFSSMPLVRLADARLEAKDAPGARKILEAALDLGMDTMAIRASLADAALATGDRAAAVAHLEKALAKATNKDEKDWLEEKLAAAKQGKVLPD